MLPPETKALLDEVIAHLRPDHESQKSRKLRELKFKMASQGLGGSSAFHKTMEQIYLEGFDHYSQQVWAEARRVLEDTDFRAYPDCEKDLIELLTHHITQVCEADLKDLRKVENYAFGATTAAFDFWLKHAIRRVATEIKILCAKLRATKNEKVEASTQTKSFVDWAGENLVTLAIVFTDIVDSTAMGQEVKDEQMNEVRRAHFTRGRELIAQFNGYEIKTMGDSFMVAFRSVEKALDFARSLQSNPGHPQIQLRAGIHIGPLRVEEGDVFGSTVNFADRVNKANKGVEIWISDRAKEDIDSLGADHHRALKWERHDGIEIKGFQGVFTLWSLMKKRSAD